MRILRRHPAPVSVLHPMEVFLLTASALQGFVVITGLAAPRSIAETLPVALRVVWSVFLLVGGIMGLTGRSWLGVYRIGLAFTGVGAITYATALFTQGRAGTVAGITFLGWALACWAQILITTRRLESLRRTVVGQ